MKTPLIRIKEETKKRTENSKHYFNNDGSYTAEIFGGPIHYKDRNSQWQDIDTTVVISDDPNYDFMNITNSIKTYFKKEISGTTENVKIIKDDSTILIKSAINLKLSDSSSIKTQKILNKVIPQKNELNKIKFSSVYKNDTKNIDIDYHILSDKLHEEFVINEPMEFPEISQEITLINVYYKLEGKSIYIYNNTTNEIIGILPPPVMFEQNNPLNTNYDLHYEIVNLTKDTFIITKILEEKGKTWFFSINRIYPLIIDTDFIATSNYLVYGSSDNYNTSRNTASTTVTTSAYVGRYADPTLFQTYRPFYKFNTSSIDSNSTIINVTITLTITTDNSTTDFDIQIIKQDWSAQDPIDSGNQETAYDNCLSGITDDNIWRNTNGILLNTPYSSGPLSTTWINKTGNTYYSLRSNRDFDNITPVNNENIRFRLLNDTTPSYRPILNVTYTVPKLIIVDNY